MGTQSFAEFLNSWIVIITVLYCVAHVINDKLFIPRQIRRGQVRRAMDRLEEIRAALPWVDPPEANPEWLLEQLRR